MPAPIVYVDHSEIVEGRLDELTERLRGLADFVEANEPRIQGYSVYLDPDGTRMSIVHIHRDAASMITHFQVAGPAFQAFVDLVRLRSIDIYGDVPDEVGELLRAKARLLGSATVSVHPFLAGFLRVDSDGVAAS